MRHASVYPQSPHLIKENQIYKFTNVSIYSQMEPTFNMLMSYNRSYFLGASMVIMLAFFVSMYTKDAEKVYMIESGVMTLSYFFPISHACLCVEDYFAKINLMVALQFLYSSAISMIVLWYNAIDHVMPLFKGFLIGFIITALMLLITYCDTRVFPEKENGNSRISRSRLHLPASNGSIVLFVNERKSTFRNFVFEKLLSKEGVIFNNVGDRELNDDDTQHGAEILEIDPVNYDTTIANLNQEDDSISL